MKSLGFIKGLGYTGFWVLGVEVRGYSELQKLPILYFKDMRPMMFHLSGFYCRVFGFRFWVIGAVRGALGDGPLRVPSRVL